VRRNATAPRASPATVHPAPVQAIVTMAQIVAAYGVRGWVRMKPHTAEPDALLRYPTWWVRRCGAADWQPKRFAEGRLHGAMLVAALDGVESREAAAQWKGALVGVPRDALPAAAEGEVYQADLVGLDVVNRSGVALGKVEAVEDFGAHPVLSVERATGPAMLIPFVQAYVDAVDVAAGRIDVDWEADY
jgi:16S rRNA processing protein RimM